MKKISFLFALLCASVMSFATQYCDFPTGHENNADFGDANGRILLSLAPTGNANEYVLSIKPNVANGNTKKLDYLYAIIGDGGTTHPYPIVAGTDESSVEDELSATFTYTGGVNTMTIQWSYPDWGGRWQCTLDNLDLSALEACAGGGSGDAKTASELSINATEKTLDASVPETFQIVATTADGYDGTVTYASSKEGIATVSASGLVTAVGRGTATITVTAPETENFAASTKKLTVTVTGPINWDGVDWLGGSDNKIKAVVDPAGPNIVNVQTRGEKGIYVTFPSAVWGDCSLSASSYTTEGAGRWYFLSAFLGKENTFTQVNQGVTYTFDVYNADGKEVWEIYDTNFALASNGASATATSGTAANAIDADNGTRWESATTDDQTWTLDMGKLRIYNTIQIRWEGAYGKTFDIESSKDGESWKTVKQVVDQALVGFPYEQSFELAANDTARYIRFKGKARGTGYGYSFWEFRVLLPGISTLTTIELSAAGKIGKIGGEGVALTVSPKDQNGKAMEAEIEYEITPADAGSVVDGKYIPAKKGNATIVAKSGEVKSGEVSVFGVTSDNLALSTNISTDNKVVAQSDFAPDGTDAFYAVDGDNGSVWQGRASNSAGVDFDAWFVVDLGGYYNIDLVTINFEGACAQNYHVDFSADNTNWALGYNYVGNAGINGRTDYISTLVNNTKVRYVRFWSTKAATEWGMKVFEFQVFGEEWQDTGDTEAPEMVSAELVSKTWNSAVIAVAATDNGEVVSYRVVNADPAIDTKLVATDGKITISGLTSATTYNFAITAIDAAGNESENSKSVAVTTDNYLTAPATAAAAPTWPAAQVKAVYSPTYNADCIFQDWGSGTTYSQDIYGKKFVLAGGGYFGVDGFSLNCLTMEKLHYDIWIADDATIRVVPIWGGPEQGVSVNLKGQQWNSIDIALTDYTAITDWSNIYQIKIDQASNLTFWIANTYFYRETELVDDVKPTNVSAVKASESYFSVVLTVSAEDNSGAVLYVVKDGENEVGSGAGASGANVNITISNLTPNTEYNFSVIAKDGNENASDPVAVTAKTLVAPEAAPVPTFSGQENIVPVFTDAQAGGPAIAFGAWGQKTVGSFVELAENDEVCYGSNFNYMGWLLTPAVDATDMEFLHVDFYSATLDKISVTPISPDHEGVKVVELTKNEWNSVDIDLSAYADNGIAWNNIFQFKFFNAVPDGGDLFIDNVYFYKQAETPSGVENVHGEKGQCVKAIENGQLVIIREGVKYNVQGQVVK